MTFFSGAKHTFPLHCLMKRKHTEKSPVYLASREGIFYVLDPEFLCFRSIELSDISDIEDAYEEKVSNIRKQLTQLDDKIHPGLYLQHFHDPLFSPSLDYVRVKEKVESWYQEQKQRIQILHEHKVTWSN